METLASFFRDGGIFMYFILATSIVGVAIIIERVIVLLYKSNVNADALWRELSKYIDEANIEKAGSICRASHVPLAAVLERGLSVHDQGERDIQSAVDEISLEVIPDIERRISYLSVIANVSTLLGLLGTIQGLIQAFTAIGSADPSQKAIVLTKGISIALYTTAFGLIVAIPMLVMYTILLSKAHRLVDEIDEFSVKLINMLVRNKSDRRTDGA